MRMDHRTSYDIKYDHSLLIGILMHEIYSL